MVRIPYQLYQSHIHEDLEGFIGNNNGDGEAQQGDVAMRQRVVQDHPGISNHWSFLFLH